MRIFKNCLSLICVLMSINTVFAQAKILKADARPRPPEIVTDEQTGTVSGPVVEILNEAARSLGYQVQWRIVPFPRTLEDLKTGVTDIVPGIFMNEERKSYMEFLGPVGTERAPVRFLMRTGQTNLLKSYEDLKKLKVGVKRGTLYFPQFDKDQAIRRVAAQDDHNMVKMLVAGRFDVMIVNDKEAAAVALERNQVTGTTWADYLASRALERYFGFSKRSKHSAIAAPFSKALKSMVKNGRVSEIYQQADLSFKEYQ
nr:transporter substrate-binding domain-containing protein [uncultured Undibacterium sp.]